MDIMLERMLSLIPKNANGKYVHGEKKVFCENIGAPINIVSEWEHGKTKSYRNYLYTIAAKYNVSVEWLQGLTDDKFPEHHSERFSDDELNLINLFRQLNAEGQERLLEYADDIVSSGKYIKKVTN